MLLLGITRQDDDPRGPASGVIYREGDKLKWGAVATLFANDPPPVLFRLLPAQGGLSQQVLERVEFTVNRAPRFLFKQKDGKLIQEELKEKLQFSEGKKALLKPQQLPKPLALPSLIVEYLEVSRLSDVMRKEMLGGERTIGQLAEVLGLTAVDKTLNETLWELSRQRWLTVHELGNPSENAIALNKPVPGLKR
jgi:hypothetical protein